MLFNNSGHGFTPSEELLSGKFGPSGPYLPSNFQHLPEDIAIIFCEASNFSLSQNSWKSYQSALNSLEKCRRETGLALSFPFTEQNSIIFASWLVKKGLSAATIEKYLSGLRAMHLAMGFSDFRLRSDLVKSLIQGRKNQGLVEESVGEKGNRIPVTPNILLLIKKHLTEDHVDPKLAILIWCVCTLLYFGGFRIGEILTDKKCSFDPFCTLLGKDITLSPLKVNDTIVETLQVTLRTDKTNKSKNAVIIDIYESKGHLCPVKAFRKFNKKFKIEPNLPAFRGENGQSFTPKCFNSFLKKFEKKYLCLEKDQSFSSHSFRAGVTTILASMGYSDEDIMAFGRWSSSAYQAYIKAPRTRRIEMAKKIAGL